MDNAVYNAIGKNYNKNRSADPRILAVIRELLGLPPGSVIADIGAGTGNYANALAETGYFIKAVEPSEEMRQQSRPNSNVEWLSGTAEAIPLKNASVGGVILILSIHHFSDIEKAAREIARICPKGPVVVFTLDPRESEEFWFDTYFPEIAQHMLCSFLPISVVVNTISCVGKWSVTIKPFLLPSDLMDKNVSSGWNRPEMYLDAEMRQNVSPFALASPAVVQRCISTLEIDLKSGEWDKHYRHLRTCTHFDAGFRFLSFHE
jgi:ubiquinone/menaquinone biosynthesis C-methylase UbiE